MSTTMTAHEIGEGWLAYVTETFMLKDGNIRPDVGEEYSRLEESDSFTQDRELWRSYTDKLIDKIIECPPESRSDLFNSTDRRSLSFVQDRIQCGTELLTALIQKGLQINMQESSSLPEFFRQILLQEQK